MVSLSALIWAAPALAQTTTNSNGIAHGPFATGAEARSGLNIYDLRLTGHLQF